MGTVTKAILGSVSGGVGSVVFAPYRDLTVVRSESKKSSKKAVQSQIDQRLKFKLVTGFISPLSSIIINGFRSAAVNSLSPMNAAVKYHLEEAVIGISPNFTIDYSKVKLSNVSQLEACDFNVVPSAGRKLEVTWNPSEEKDADLKAKRDTDSAIIIFYGTTSGMYYDYSNSATRGEGQLTASIAKRWKDDVIHGWMFFLSANKRTASKSYYLGEHTLLA